MNGQQWAAEVDHIRALVGPAELTAPGYQAMGDQIHMLMQQGGTPEQVVAMFRSLVPDVAEAPENEILLAACIFVALKDA